MARSVKSDSVSKDLLFDLVFGKSNEGIFLTRFDGVIEKANPAVSALTGYSLSELEDRSILDLLHVTDRHKRQDEIDNLLAGKVDCVRASRKFVTNAGHTVPFSIRTYPIHKDGHIVRLLTFLWWADTEQRPVDETVEQRVRHLEDLLDRYGKAEDWKMVNNIHLGDEVGGDKAGRDKIINDQRVFYFIAVVLLAITSALTYLGYLLTFQIHKGDAQPPQQHQQINHDAHNH